ncbi:hypothetical protein B0J18DRAFT_492436 [Chaetomium sp. MPI-SDFR-AT-0129]|nr:hypothetical protein B0J18DRAFT_492436 [Chaetomium sp. MPI-SDFR-AT-0129]
MTKITLNTGLDAHPTWGSFFISKLHSIPTVAFYAVSFFESRVSKMSNPDSVVKPECFHSVNGQCRANKNNLYGMFPDLKVLPHPEPDSAIKGDHEAWQQEYEQWQGLKYRTAKLQHAGELNLDKNKSLAQSVLSELSTLPSSIAQNIFKQIEGKMDLTTVQQWLVRGVAERPPPTPPADGTCLWLLEHPNFLTWRAAEQSPVLWVQGLPGRGKTTLAGYAVQRLESEAGRTFFHGFHRSAQSTQSTPTTFAASLILQILRRQDPAAVPATSGSLHQLECLAAQYPLGPQEASFSKIWDILWLLLLAESRWTLVIDAMDECVFDSPSSPQLSTFLDAFTDMVKSGLSIYMFADMLLRDVMIFAEGEYAHAGLPSSERDLVLNQIRQKSDGSFQWVRLFLDHLRRSPRATDLQRRLKTLPPTISQLYKTSLVESASRMDEDEVNCRRDILLLCFQTQRALTTAEVADALALPPDRAENIISRLCKPLVSTYGGFVRYSHPSVQEFFESCHRSNEDISLGLRFADSHKLLAKKCLETLMREEHADLNRIGSLLRAGHGADDVGIPAQSSGEDGFYSYASRAWDYHITQAESPDIELLQRANEFLLSYQFAFWAEYSRKDFGQPLRVLQALNRLKPWHSKLSSNMKRAIKLDRYFSDSYLRLSTAYEAGGEGLVMYLALLSLGDFYFDMGSPEKLAPVRERVHKGLQDLLGPRHVLSLRAKSDVGYVRLYGGRVREAWRIYTEVADAQREVVGKDDIHYLGTLIYKGESEYYGAGFDTAILTFTAASAGILKTLGPDSWQYTGAQMWYAFALAQLNRLDEAADLLQAVRQRRRDQFGPQDTFATAVQIALAEVLQMLGRDAEAIDYLQLTLEERRGTYSLSDIFRLDVELALARAYNATGLLLAGEDEAIGEAIDLLQDVLVQAERDQNNRALLWIRLDLATLLRQRRDPGDEEQASSNFDNIIKDVSGDCEPGLLEHPDPPRLLAIAENALRLVRSRESGEARKLLDSELVDWVRPKDLWLWIGGTFFP